jgi:hypothetical protein
MHLVFIAKDGMFKTDQTKLTLKATGADRNTCTLMTTEARREMPKAS